MKNILCSLFIVMFLTGCLTTHGALKVAAGVNGPWILTNDGSIYEYKSSIWNQQEAPGTADDLEICGTFLTIMTKKDAQGKRTVKSRTVFGGAWTTYPSLDPFDVKQVACDGYAPVVLASLATTQTTFKSVFKFSPQTQSWELILNGAAAISVENGYLFYLSATTTGGNVWSGRVVGPYTQWGSLVANKIAGDANGLPWVSTNTTSNPLYKWDTNNQKWTFGFNSGPVYEMDIQSYVMMYILSDPQISGGGYTLYSHDLYSGGWTTYSLPRY